jgi:hypothetical protein
MTFSECHVGLLFYWILEWSSCSWTLVCTLRFKKGFDASLWSCACTRSMKWMGACGFSEKGLGLLYYIFQFSLTWCKLLWFTAIIFYDRYLYFCSQTLRILHLLWQTTMQIHLNYWYRGLPCSENPRVTYLPYSYRILLVSLPVDFSDLMHKYRDIWLNTWLLSSHWYLHILMIFFKFRVFGCAMDSSWY